METIKFTGWYKIYELEREKREDGGNKTRLVLDHEERKKEQKLEALIRKGECDD